MCRWWMSIRRRPWSRGYDRLTRTRPELALAWTRNLLTRSKPLQNGGRKCRARVWAFPRWTPIARFVRSWTILCSKAWSKMQPQIRWVPCSSYLNWTASSSPMMVLGCHRAIRPLSTIMTSKPKPELSNNLLSKIRNWNSPKTKYACSRSQSDKLCLYLKH